MDPSVVTADADVFTANAYLVTGQRNTLVDAGAMPGVVDAIREHVETLDSVVITHRHEDHVARLPEVYSAFEPDVYAFEADDETTHTVADGETVAIGDETFEAVHTPGHADDHLAFVGETALFSGDVVVYNDGAFEDGSFGRTDRPGQDRETLIESIRRLRARVDGSVTELYAGHGDVYRGDVGAVLERALERAERREPKYPG